MENILKKLREIINSDSILLNEPMSEHTTFKTGGNADIFIKIGSADELKKIICLLKSENYPYFVLGKGSNLLVSDKGIRGVVLYMGGLKGIVAEGESVTSYSGNSLASVAGECLKNSLTGFEFASGIPGTVGGAMYMNAGAYGSEMNDIIESVVVLDKDNNIVKRNKDELKLGYRSSVIQENGDILISAKYRLKKGDKEKIRQKMSELNLRRKEKQPLEFASAGSTFKRPKGYFAGKLIEDSGLKGFEHCGAAVSDKHCGFIVNLGSARTEDILYVIDYVRDKVYNKFGVKLQTEVKFIGEK